MNAPEILEQVRRLDAELVVKNGKLKATAPGVLPLELKVAAIRDRAAEIKAALAEADADEAPDSGRNRWPDSFRVPMPLRSCRRGSPWFWLSPFGAVKCTACDPPADLNLAEVWILAREAPGNPIPSEILSMLRSKGAA